MKGKRLLALILSFSLLTGCQTNLVSQQLVIASIGVDVTNERWNAAFEVMREDENKTFTVQGKNFSELFAAAEKKYGFPLYLGAMECMLFSGVRDSAQYAALLTELQNDPRIAPNTQMALCDDAIDFLTVEKGGGSATEALTARYTRSNDYSLKQELCSILSPGMGTLIPLLTMGENGAVISTFVPSKAADYAIRWRGNIVSEFLAGRLTSADRTFSDQNFSAQVSLRNLRVANTDFSDPARPIVILAVTAVLENVSGETQAVTRDWLNGKIREELAADTASLQNIVVRQGNTDYFGIGKRATLRGINNIPEEQNLPSQSAQFQFCVNLQDPKEILSNAVY